jgi:hypothetical protein
MQSFIVILYMNIMHIDQIHPHSDFDYTCVKHVKQVEEH